MNDRIQLGFIGVGNRGGQLLDAFLTHSDAQVTAICDVYQPYLERATEKIGTRVETYGDFRQLIASPHVDAVVIATPDHWHAIQCIDACNAGKDVYVEKPLSITIHEGRKMVEAARRNDRVVQVGTHRRSSPLYARLAKIVRGGEIGHVTVSRSYRLSNMWPSGIGRASPSTPPQDLDWEMWLGPTARAALSRQHLPIQVSLVEELLVPDGQLGRPLSGRHTLDDGRLGAVFRLRDGRPVRGG